MIYKNILNIAIPIICAPFLIGIINKTKAFFAGRKGQSVFQAYYDVIKLLKKDFIYSNTVSLIFRINPIIGISTVLLILALVPVPGLHPVFSFHGDVLLVIFLLGLIRFFTVISALDTGSSFEGMGASREVLFSVLIEPALFFIFSSIIFMTKNVTLYDLLTNKPINFFTHYSPELLAITISFFVIILAENSRIPFDDPCTHLELTMVHEVMVLDNSSFDLALIEYTSYLKLWIFEILLVNILLPFSPDNYVFTILWFAAGLFILSVLIGIIESIFARLRFVKIPLLLIGVNVLTVIIYILFIYR